MSIHPTAQISDSVTLAEDVHIGAFCILDGEISIGAGTRIAPGVHLFGKVTIGNENRIHSHAVIGDTPQDLSYSTQIQSEVIIGDRNTIRENVTIHRAATQDGITRLGSDNMLMAGVHLAHDCQVGNNTILANNCLLAGHVTVGDHVFLGGGAGLHQFVKIGNYAMSQGNCAITQDLPPYCMCYGRNQLAGLNSVGLKRAGFTPDERKEIKRLFTLLLGSGKNLSEALQEAETQNWSERAQILLNAVKTPSKKRVMTR